MEVNPDQHFVTRGELFSLVSRVLSIIDTNNNTYHDIIQVSLPEHNIFNLPTHRTLLSTTSIWLGDLVGGAAFYEDVRPGKKGKKVIFAHSSKYWWDPNPYGTVFEPLINDLQPDHTITVTAGEQNETYRIIQKQKIPEWQVETVRDAPDAVDLILFTCDYDISERWIFFAEKIDPLVPIQKNET